METRYREDMGDARILIQRSYVLIHRTLISGEKGTINSCVLRWQQLIQDGADLKPKLLQSFCKGLRLTAHN